MRISPLFSSSLEAACRSLSEDEAAGPQLVPSTELKIGSAPFVVLNLAWRLAGVADQASDGLWQVPQLRPLLPRALKNGLDCRAVVRLTLDH